MGGESELLSRYPLISCEYVYSAAECGSVDSARLSAQMHNRNCALKISFAAYEA